MGSDRIRSKRFPGVYYRESVDKTFKGKPDRVWWIVFRDARGRQKWERIGPASQGVTDAYAAQKLVERKNLIGLGENPSAGRKHVPNLDEVAAAFFEVDRLEGHHTAKEENRYERHIKPSFGTSDLVDITDTALTRHKARLLEVLAPASTKLVFALLRRMVNFALKKKLWRGTSPFGVTSDFKMPKVENKSERYLTDDECARLMDELEKRSVQTRDMAVLALRTAMRSTEIFELRGKDIDFDRESIFIEAKAGKRYELYVGKDVLKMLRRYQRAPQEFVFQKRKGGQLAQISKSFERAVDALGLNNGITDKRSKVWFHTLRHTCISRWAQSGRFTINELMEAARHETMSMTLRYAHLIPGGTRSKIAELDREFHTNPSSQS